MSAFDIIEEGMIKTAALNLYHLRTKPKNVSQGRILFLGGSNYDLKLKRQILNSCFVKTHEVATYEPRGIGRSDSPDGIWTMADYAKDAMSFLEAIGWNNAHIIGESFGGMTALHLALQKPQVVESMVITSATAGGVGGASYDISEFLECSREEAAEKAMCLQDTRMVELKSSDPVSFIQKLESRISFETAFAETSLKTGGYQRLLAARRKHDVWKSLPEIQSPTLVIAGEHDLQAPPKHQEKMASRLTNATFWKKQGGHGLLFAEVEVAEDINTLWLEMQTTVSTHA